MENKDIQKIESFSFFPDQLNHGNKNWSADKSYGRQIVRTLDKPYGDKLYGLISLGQTVRKTNRTDCLD